MTNNDIIQEIRKGMDQFISMYTDENHQAEMIESYEAVKAKWADITPAKFGFLTLAVIDKVIDELNHENPIKMKALAEKAIISLK